MGQGLGGTTQQQQQNNSSQATATIVPDWVTNQSMFNIGTAQNINAAGYDPNRSPTVAPLDPMSNTAAANTAGYVASGGPQAALDKAASITQGVAGYNPLMIEGRSVSAPGVAGNDAAITGAMNPYIKNVVDTTNAVGKNALTQALQDYASSADKAKAFGGSRADIVDSNAIAQYGIGAGKTAADLYSQGYDKATGLLTSDAARKLQADTTTGGWGMTADQANQAAVQAAAGIRGGAGAQLASIAGQSQNAFLTDQTALNQFGTQAQTQAQAQRDAATAGADKSYATAQANLQSLISALSSSQYSTYGYGTSQGTRTTETSSTPDWASLALGGATLARGGIPR